MNDGEEWGIRPEESGEEGAYDRLDTFKAIRHFPMLSKAAAVVTYGASSGAHSRRASHKRDQPDPQIKKLLPQLHWARSSTAGSKSTFASKKRRLADRQQEQQQRRQRQEEGEYGHGAPGSADPHHNVTSVHTTNRTLEELCHSSYDDITALRDVQRSLIASRISRDHSKLQLQQQQQQQQQRQTQQQHGGAAALAKLARHSKVMDPTTHTFDAFYDKRLTSGQLRHLLLSFFGVILTQAETESVVDHFECRKGGEHVSGRLFLNQLLLLGREERDRDAQANAAARERQRRSRDEKGEKVRQEVEAINDMILATPCDSTDLERGLSAIRAESLKLLNGRCAHESTAVRGSFHCSLCPADFRDQLRLSFAVVLDDAAFCALYKAFDRDGNGVIDGEEFLGKFLALGIEEREKKHETMARVEAERRDREKRKHSREVLSLSCPLGR